MLHSQSLIELYRQKIVPTKQDIVATRYEVLLRFNMGGRVHSPRFFLEMAQAKNLLVVVEEVVIRKLFGLLAECPGLEVYHLNLSSLSLLDKRTCDLIAALLDANHISPSRLCIELLENEPIRNPVIENLLHLRKIGCELAIDDFGTGMLSFEHLEAIKPDFVKVAGKYCRRVGDELFSRAVVEGIVRACQSLGIKTVAESVETETIRETTEAIGVDYQQGWLYDYPARFNCLLPETNATQPEQPYADHAC